MRVHLAVIAAIASLPAALGQQSSFTLDESGRWVVERPAEDLTGDEQLLADARVLLAGDDPATAYGLLDERLDAGGLRADLAPEALLLRGDALLAMGREFKALYDYEQVIRDFPRSPQFRIAVEREFDIANMYLHGLQRRLLGFRVLNAEDAAVELLIRVQERLPGSLLAERANITLADFFFDQREIDLAAEAYEVYLLNFPDGEHEAHVKQQLIYADLARFKGPRYDASVLLDAQLQAEQFAERYPVSAREANLDEGLQIRIDESLAAQMLEQVEYHLRRDDEPSARYVITRLLERHPATVAAEAARRLVTERGWTDIEMTPAGRLDRADQTAAETETEGVRIEGQLEGRVEGQVDQPTTGDDQE